MKAGAFYGGHPPGCDRAGAIADVVGTAATGNDSARPRIAYKEAALPGIAPLRPP
jgi:hypothetical protein